MIPISSDFRRGKKSENAVVTVSFALVSHMASEVVRAEPELVPVLAPW